MCVCVCVYGYIKVWVSYKIQSRFQQKMCLVYREQNCLFLSTFETGNLNLFFYCHNCHIVITAFYESYHKIGAAILRITALQI